MASLRGLGYLQHRAGELASEIVLAKEQIEALEYRIFGLKERLREIDAAIAVELSEAEVGAEAGEIGKLDRLAQAVAPQPVAPVPQRRNVRGEVKAYFVQKRGRASVADLVQGLGIPERSARTALAYLTRKRFLTQTGEDWRLTSGQREAPETDAADAADMPPAANDDAAGPDDAAAGSEARPAETDAAEDRAAGSGRDPEANPEPQPNGHYVGPTAPDLSYRREPQTVGTLVDMLSAWPDADGMTLRQIESRGIGAEIVAAALSEGRIVERAFGAITNYAIQPAV